MSIVWLRPEAWWGLIAIALPVLIHLLVRQRSRRIPFPTLRFLRATQLAAFRRRVIADWPLLIVRMLILAAAVAALAAPVVVSDSRRAAWNQRVVRALVVVPATAQNAEMQRAVADERRASFASATFETIADAAAWLTRQPPAAREIVVVGDLRRGSISVADIEPIAPFVGIRFLPFPDADPPVSARLFAVSADESAPATPFAIDVTLLDSHSTVRYVESSSPTPSIAVHASPMEQEQADAMLRAVLAEGIALGRHVERRLAVIFAGAEDRAARGLLQPASQLWMRDALARVPEVRGGERDGTLVVMTGVSPREPGAARLLARIAGAAFADDLNSLEPMPMRADLLAAWSRAPGVSPDNARPADEGDRRWLWGAALALLAMEWWMRGARATARTPAQVAGTDAEARVA